MPSAAIQYVITDPLLNSGILTGTEGRHALHGLSASEEPEKNPLGRSDSRASEMMEQCQDSKIL